jgi:hypothetical protein
MGVCGIVVAIARPWIASACGGADTAGEDLGGSAAIGEAPEVVRNAAGDGLVINGCIISGRVVPSVGVPDANSSQDLKADADGADFTGAAFANATMPDGSVRNS